MTLRDIWAAYEDAWSESDPAKRAVILSRTLDEEFIYSDPLVRTDSRDALSHYIGDCSAPFRVCASSLYPLPSIMRLASSPGRCRTATAIG